MLGVECLRLNRLLLDRLVEELLLLLKNRGLVLRLKLGDGRCHLLRRLLLNWNLLLLDVLLRRRCVVRLLRVVRSILILR